MMQRDIGSGLPVVKKMKVLVTGEAEYSSTHRSSVIDLLKQLWLFIECMIATGTPWDIS
jgi:hypothetical protein